INCQENLLVNSPPLSSNEPDGAWRFCRKQAVSNTSAAARRTNSGGHRGGKCGHPRAMRVQSEYRHQSATNQVFSWEPTQFQCTSSADPRATRLVSKSCARKGRVGSTPTFGTMEDKDLRQRPQVLFLSARGAKSRLRRECIASATRPV